MKGFPWVKSLVVAEGKGFLRGEVGIGSQVLRKTGIGLEWPTDPRHPWGLACPMPTNLSSLLVVQTDSFSLSFQSQN